MILLGREVEFDESELTLKLTGFVSFCALKSKVVMPYKTIMRVYVDYFDVPRWMIRLPGTSISPLNIYEGSFLHNNKWYFLSYERKEPLVIIELDGHKKYSYVIFAINDPTETAAEIRRKLANFAS